MNHVPSVFLGGSTFFEPFLGAGSLFFRLKPERAVLSDKNRELIECYKAVKKNPVLVSKYLARHLKLSSEEYYYRKRKEFNTLNHSISRASLFIYLNKTSFNGIWRVNDNGEFNVPYGYKEPPSLPSRAELEVVSRALSKARLLHADYKTAVKSVKSGDFVYFDPPYPPLNGTSYFTHYTRERFSKKDHEELAELSRELAGKGCHILISNSDTEYIRSLYEREFRIFDLEVTRWIRTDGRRYKVKEIAITNYNVDSVYSKTARHLPS